MTIDTTAPEAAVQSDLPATIDEAVERARAIRPAIAALGIEVDALGIDPAEAMRLAADAGVMAVNVPAEFGGLWCGDDFAGWDRSTEIAIEVAAGEGSTGQCWATTALMAREIFTSSLPRVTKAVIADELLHEGRRIVASNAETGGTGPVVGRRVEGGIVVTGVKTFNTNSGGGGRDLANVGIAMDGPDGVPARHHALIRLDDPAVKLHGDWDNMGQRGTVSQTITYDQVFVPDGWFWKGEAAGLGFVASVLSGHTALLQGIGEGAYTATLEYLRKLNRPSMPMFGSAAEDVLIHRQLGEIASRLSASRAYLLQACRLLAAAREIDELTAVTVEMFKAKVASTAAALDATARLHDMTGARSTANAYRLDRFWRNARTFASHDSIDAKSAFIGAYEFTGELPDFGQYIPGIPKR